MGVRFLLILMSIYFKENLSIAATKYKTEDTENYINKVKLQNIRLLITPIWGRSFMIHCFSKWEL